MSNISLKELILRNNYLQNLKNGVIQHINSFKANLSEKATDLKKNAAPRLMALMLAGTTLASMTACDEIGGSKNVEHGDLFNQAGQVEVVDGVSLNDLNEDNYSDYIYDIQEAYPYGVAPYKFLKEQGALECDENGNYIKNGNLYDNYIVVDENTPENDVYLLVSCLCKADDTSDNGIYCRWKLKYVLDDKDYQDIVFLSANQDVRLLGFVDYMEDKYQYEIVSQTITGNALQGYGWNWIRLGTGYHAFSLENIDTNTGEVKFRSLKMHGNYVREVVYTTNLKDGEFWDRFIKKGFSEEYILNNTFLIIDTELGKGYDYNSLELSIFGAKTIFHSEKIQSIPYETINEYKAVLTNGGVSYLKPNNEANYDKTIKQLNENYKNDKKNAEDKYYSEMQLEQ